MSRLVFYLFSKIGSMNLLMVMIIYTDLNLALYVLMLSARFLFISSNEGVRSQHNNNNNKRAQVYPIITTAKKDYFSHQKNPSALN